MKPELSIKEKRNRILQFLAKYCECVKNDLMNLNIVESISEYSKEDFCDIVDLIIDEIDERFSILDKNSNRDKYVKIPINNDTMGWTDKNNEISGSHSVGWLRNELDNFSFEEQIAFSKDLCIIISEDYQFSIQYVYSVYRDDIRDDLLINCWLGKTVQYQFESFGEIDILFTGV